MKKVLILFLLFGFGCFPSLRAQTSMPDIRIRIAKIDSFYKLWHPEDDPYWHEMIKKCNDVLKDDTTDSYAALALFYRGTAHLFLNNNKAASSDYYKSISIYPYIFDDYDKISVILEEKYGIKGFCKQRSSIWRKAEKNYRIFLKTDSSNSNALYEFAKIKMNLYRICENKADLLTGINACRQAIKYDSTNALAWDYFGEYHPDIDSGIYILKKGLEKCGDWWLMREHLFVKVFYDKKHYSEALKILNEGIAIDPDQYQYYSWRAIIYKALGNKKAAAEDTRHFNELLKKRQ